MDVDEVVGDEEEEERRGTTMETEGASWMRLAAGTAGRHR